MKLFASLAFGAATLVASSFGLAQPAMADDEVTIGVRLGPLCVGLCIGGGGGGGHSRHAGRGYDYDNDDGFYSRREDTYHQRYDRRDTDDEYAEARNDGYAGYRRNQHHRHHHERDDDE